MPGALEGVRVIDLTAVLLGPFATQHLADMGADVIKVEPPEGDLLRASGGAMGRDRRMGPVYMAANRNKRSICLDLKKPSAGYHQPSYEAFSAGTLGRTSQPALDSFPSKSACAAEIGCGDLRGRCRRAAGVAGAS
jgi:hypothetical protein